MPEVIVKNANHAKLAGGVKGSSTRMKKTITGTRNCDFVRLIKGLLTIGLLQ